MSEFAVGDEGPTVRVDSLSRQDFVRYAGASGDFNPLHYDEPYATDAGNDSVFGQGMLTASIASNVVTEWFGVGAVRTFETRFEGQVWPGDSLEATGTVAAVDGETVDVELEVTTDDDRTVITGRATVDASRVGDGDGPA